VHPRKTLLAIAVLMMFVHSLPHFLQKIIISWPNVASTAGFPRIISQTHIKIA
jgi:hypothetical protein